MIGAGLWAVARAGVNIALVKYWGKRDAALNLPATGSLSLTLAGMGTRTAVRFDRALEADRVRIDGAPAGAAEAARVRRFLDLVRAIARIDLHADVVSASTVPIAAGLASSASAFAALAAAAARAAGLDLDPTALSALARRGSGSAARSVFGGFVEMAHGERADGADAAARPLLAPEAWDVRIVVAEIATSAKEVGSSEGMERTARTSPYHAAFVAAQAADLDAARDAVARRDLDALGAIAEANALRMHADMLAARPPLLYWSGATVEALRCVQSLRRAGCPAWATIDAGPNVKALCAASDAERVAAALAEVHGVSGTRTLRPGPGVEVAVQEHAGMDHADPAARSSTCG